jgi:hypothetical protein
MSETYARIEVQPPTQLRRGRVIPYPIVASIGATFGEESDNSPGQIYAVITAFDHTTGQPTNALTGSMSASAWEGSDDGGAGGSSSSRTFYFIFPNLTVLLSGVYYFQISIHMIENNGNFTCLQMVYTNVVTVSGRSVARERPGKYCPPLSFMSPALL